MRKGPVPDRRLVEAGVERLLDDIGRRGVGLPPTGWWCPRTAEFEGDQVALLYVRSQQSLTQGIGSLIRKNLHAPACR